MGLDERAPRVDERLRLDADLASARPWDLGGADRVKRRAGRTVVRGVCLLVLTVALSGCSDCDRASYSKAEVQDSGIDVGPDLADADAGKLDAGDVPDPPDLVSDTPEDVAVDVPGDMGRDVPPDLGLPPECPWALSGCVLLAATDPEDCGPLGCGLAAPSSLWVDALPCQRLPVQVTLPRDAAGWEVDNAGVNDQDEVSFDLLAEGRGRARCRLQRRGIEFYPASLTCRDGDAEWTTSVAMNAAACEDCPSIQGCYRVEGLDSTHMVALFQRGCDLSVVSGDSDGRRLPQAGTVGPAGQAIFRIIGQVADSICALPPPLEGGGFEGFACAHSQLGLPGNIESQPETRLIPQPWSECSFVSCVDDEDCAGDPAGPVCVRGQCSMR